jgi:hypothetical protein
MLRGVAGFNAGAPGAIGGTTPAAGTFTPLTASVPSTGTEKIGFSSPAGNTRADATVLFSLIAGKYSRTVISVTEAGTLTLAQGIDLAGATAGLSFNSAGGLGITATQWRMVNATVGIGTSATSGEVEVNNNTQGQVRDFSARAIRASDYVKTTAKTVATLPVASTAGAGARSFVTDATATTFLSTVAGGGANPVPVVSDGTNWLIG